MRVETQIERMKKRQGSRTQKEFADELGVTEAYLSMIYKRVRNPGPAIFRAMGWVKDENIKEPKQR